MLLFVKKIVDVGSMTRVIRSGARSAMKLVSKRASVDQHHIYKA
jgi:hypothetical protein